MANSDEPAPIIIKRVKKVVHGGHHGGAWKVAYADFVTAMMAFFLLMWLLNMTTEEQRRGIADYFSPASLSKSSSGAGGLLGGTTVSEEGAMSSTRTSVGAPATEEPAQSEETAEASEETVEAKRIRLENEQFAETEKVLLQAVQSVPEMKEMVDHLVIEQTPEGLLIQIVDQAGRSLFPSGSDEMLEHTRRLLQQVADSIVGLPQQIAIKGHTDANPYVNDDGYSNWELSADRANATRRALIEAGVPVARFDSVAGRAAQQPLVPADPFSPENRRIAIILLREATLPPGAARKLKAAEAAN